MTKKQRQPKSENPLNDPRRLYTCSYKASWWQVKEIERLAHECGEDVSTYVVMRALNYQPKQRLSDEERVGLDNLHDCRSDIRKFFNALEGMKRDERQLMFRRHSFMIEWMRRLMVQHDRIGAYLDRVEARNERPQASSSESGCT